MRVTIGFVNLGTVRTAVPSTTDGSLLLSDASRQMPIEKAPAVKCKMAGVAGGVDVTAFTIFRFAEAASLVALMLDFLLICTHTTGAEIVCTKEAGDAIDGVIMVVFVIQMIKGSSIIFQMGWVNDLIITLSFENDDLCVQGLFE
jgi:hypothetical protein